MSSRCLEFAMPEPLLIHAARKVASSLRPSSNPGDGFGPVFPRPVWLKSMRTVAAVLALVACVHAGLWAPYEDQSRARFQRAARQRFLLTVRRLTHIPIPASPDRRANPRRSESHRALYPRHPHLFVDRRRRAGAGDRRRIRAARSRSAPGSTRTRIATSAKSAPRSISRGTTATSTPSSSATKPRCAPK